MRNKKPYSELSREIDVLINEGHDILEVVMGDDINFFLVDSFEPPIGGTVHTAPYLQFNGVLINEFFSNSIYNQGDVASYKSSFNNKFQASRKSKFKLSQSHDWRLYSI